MSLLDSFWVLLAVKLLALTVVVLGGSLVIIYAELKVGAHMQNRVGPYYAGVRWGWAQPLADGLAMIHASIARAETEGSFDRYPEMKAHLHRLPPLFRLTPPRPFPFTLVHGDLRSDNVFFPTAAGGRFAMIDWQMCGVDQAALDIAKERV